jgi:hypothetical protein
MASTPESCELRAIRARQAFIGCSIQKLEVDANRDLSVAAANITAS